MSGKISRQILKSIRRILFTVALIIGALWIYLAQPSFRKSPPATESIDTERMAECVRKLSEDFHPRSFRDTSNLEATAAYIEQHFRQSGGSVLRQEFEVSGESFRNIRCVFGNNAGPRIIIGAHYDSHGDTPGADDNASGIAGLLELAYLFKDFKSEGCIELVAYPLEEPPFFTTTKMGSYIHAKQVSETNTEVIGAIVLEMIGYFSDAPDSQDYPALLLKILYPNTGNFIGVIGKLDQRPFTKRVKVGMKGATNLPVYSVNAPAVVPGIDFSDHRNYWPFGYDAVMITDTSFYRNTAYHKENDTWNRLDYKRMGKVVLGVHSATLQLLEDALTNQSGEPK